MSDTPRGPDWWQASDGAWYPPNMSEESLRLTEPITGPTPAVDHLGLIYRRVHGMAVLLLTSVIGGGLAAFGSTLTEDGFQGEELTSAGQGLVAGGGVVALVGLLAAASFIFGDGEPAEPSTERTGGRFYPPTPS